MLALQGIGVTRGVAIGRVRLIYQDHFEVTKYPVPAEALEAEIARYERAVEVARVQLQSLRERVPTSAPVDIGAFLDVHLLMLQDSAFRAVPRWLIKEHGCNAEWALQLQRTRLVQAFEDIGDNYLRGRKDDVEHVVKRILYALINQHSHVEDGEGDWLSGSVVLAEDLAPADLVVMHHQGASAFILEYGTPTSHAAILARSLAVPTVLGVRHARRYLQEDEVVVVGGDQGTVLAGADDRALSYYRRLQTTQRRRQAALRQLRDKPAVTRDGVEIGLSANIDLPEDISSVTQVSTGGVGLCRTEFLFMNRDRSPDEEEQLEAYGQVVTSLMPAPVTIRTVDLGADKPATGDIRLDGMNPALGLRGIRLCLREPELFRPQLRAILRASALGPVRMVLPMLTNCHELRQVLRLIEEVKAELQAQGLDFDPKLPVGAMIEVPAAAVAADSLARQAGFLSIGTNDLIQYALATDRLDDQVDYLYDPLHPAVLRLIRLTIEAGEHAGIQVVMCGEMAGDPRFTRLLLGMGLRHFSMHPSSLLEVKQQIRRSRIDRLTSISEQLLAATEPGEMTVLLESLNTG